MTVHDQTIAKIRQMPESLVEKVSDFIDFLLWKHSGKQWEVSLESAESREMVESDFCEYLPNLEDYENRLARGEIQW
ncbi:hypothetical protein [Brasilonema sp. UFV-L1]|uniref:hypothetical protein n=1 Tax=Brasilonema sp. UFV-L1 TaxID=2234130 RepID=UPI00145E1115|nr:hypothetical protein [Brasilonema sp. UFV-L1]NMG11313.1 hypothetical protein [Brasilonema sp. UFV-L1]